VTPQEEQLLNSLVERVNQTQLQEKDPDAEALLNRNLGNNPDSLYILAQTILVQNIALEQAKAQVGQLQHQVQQARQQPAHATSFLGSLLGHRDPEPPPPLAYAPVPQYAPVSQQAYVPPPPPPQYQQAQYAPVAGGYAPVAGGQPSFLRGAMQTAAGVAAGALAFEGVESIIHGIGGMGHPGYEWGGGGMGMGPGMMGAGFERPVEETVVNNYYDQPGSGGEQHFHESTDRESADRLQDQGGSQFSDASYNTSGDDQNYSDNTLTDDSSNFDNSTVDDSGGFDDGGGGFGGDNSGGDLS
jgi:hypothetical protein